MKVIHTRKAEQWNEWHNTVCIGYAVLAAQKAGFTEEQVKSLVLELYEAQMYEGKLKTPAEAKEAFNEWLKNYEIE